MINNALMTAVRVDGTPLKFPKLEYAAVFPELLLIGAALLLLLLASLTREKADQRSYAFYTSLVGFVSLASTYWLGNDLTESGSRSAFAGAIVYDRFALFFVAAISVALILGALMSESWLRRRNLEGPEYFVLMMLASSGGMLMAAANDLIVVFLGLEIMSIALYILVGFNRHSESSREAAIKYFILGSFASAIFLYGIALTYGAIGTTNLSGISGFLAANTLLDDGLLLAGMSLMGVGFAFKVAAVPFQQWTPDVYTGAPTPVVGFMAALAKAAAFAALIRVFASTLYVMKEDWQPVFITIAILTCLVGAAAACVQNNIKRMMAYSSINHAGFILLGLQVANADGVSAAMFYILAYVFMVLGTFAIIGAVGGTHDSNHSLEKYKGLAQRNPMLAVAFTILLLGQAGLPLTSGFIAKFYVISSLIETDLYLVALFAMLTAAIAAYFYLRIVFTMYTPIAFEEHNVIEDQSVIEDQDVNENAAHMLPRTAQDEMKTATSSVYVPELPTTQADAPTAPKALVLPWATLFVVGISVVFTLAFGILPEDWMHVITYTREASAAIFG